MGPRHYSLMRLFVRNRDSKTLFPSPTDLQPRNRTASGDTLAARPSENSVTGEPTFRNLEQLRSAAERAFGRPFVTGDSTEFCVFQKVLFTLMRVGPHVLSFLYYTKPYFDENSQ